jgi:hypothetical protein
MNYFAKGVLTAMTFAGLLSLPVVVQAAQAQQQSKQMEPDVCDNRAARVRAVKLAAPVLNTVDFSGTNGGLEPLLETQIYVGGKKGSCVIAHFSAQVSTGDNTVVFQASIDDVPMEGHALYPDELRDPQLTTPIVLDRGTVFRPTNPIPVPTMASYNFFQIVKAGWHTVKIKWAGCCSSDPASVSAEALAAVLTLEYRGKLAHYEEDDD